MLVRTHHNATDEHSKGHLATRAPGPAPGPLNYDLQVHELIVSNASTGSLIGWQGSQLAVF